MGDTHVIPWAFKHPSGYRSWLTVLWTSASSFNPAQTNDPGTCWSQYPSVPPWCSDHHLGSYGRPRSLCSSRKDLRYQTALWHQLDPVPGPGWWAASRTSSQQHTNNQNLIETKATIWYLVRPNFFLIQSKACSSAKTTAWIGQTIQLFIDVLWGLG